MIVQVVYGDPRVPTQWYQPVNSLWSCNEAASETCHVVLFVWRAIWWSVLLNYVHNPRIGVFRTCLLLVISYLLLKHYRRSQVCLNHQYDHNRECILFYILYYHHESVRCD